MSDQKPMNSKALLTLADPNRVWILEALARSGDMTVTEMSSFLTISRQAVAKHLTTLTAQGFVTSYPSSDDRRETYYQLSTGEIVRACDGITAWAKSILRGSTR